MSAEGLTNQFLDFSTVSGVQRQRINVADPSTFAAVASVDNSQPGSSEYGLTVRHAGVASTGGVLVTPSATLTRAANTTQYTTMQVVKDASNAYQTFTGCARTSGGSGLIVAAGILDEVNSTTPLSPMLFLFTTAPTNSTFADLSALALANADGLLLVPGSPITFAVSTTVNASAAPNGATYYSVQGLSMGFVANATSLFGVLVSGSSYVPKSGGLLIITLTIVQN